MYTDLYIQNTHKTKVIKEMAMPFGTIFPKYIFFSFFMFLSLPFFREKKSYIFSYVFQYMYVTTPSTPGNEQFTTSLNRRHTHTRTFKWPGKKRRGGGEKERE